MANLVFATIVLLAMFGPVLTISKIKISPSLQASLKTTTHHDIIVSFKSTTAVLNKIRTTSFETRAAKIDSMKSQLQLFAEASQKSVLEVLNTPGQLSATHSSFESFWISNEIFVREADSSLIQAIAGFEDVVEVRAQKIITLDSPIGSRIAQAPLPGTIQPGVQLIGSKKLWEQGINGTDVIVGGIDTGVRLNHVALKNNFVGENGWFDRISTTVAPTDQNGHGTHTMGTIVGVNGIGVAPGARWMACRACNAQGECAEADLKSCGQFMICPTSGNCSKSTAPHIVSNSWGGSEQGSSFYDAVIAVWHEAKIIPVFAIGNSGPKCGTLSSPGDRNVIGVGSTTHDDSLSSFSSSGPSLLANPKLIKPDIVAPGDQILSTWFTYDDSYQLLSGTSMATPHISGVIALMLGNQPNLTYIEIRDLLFTGATRSVKHSGKNCGGIVESTFPNHAFGHGRVDALESITGNGNGSSILSVSIMLHAVLIVSVYNIFQF